MLILLALLTDAIYLKRSLARWSTQPDPVNPFVPLSPYTEHERMLASLRTALSGWQQSFHSVEPDVQLLHHYIQLYLVFSEVTTLAAGVGYPDTIIVDKPDITVPDTAAKFSWQILDAAAAVSSTKDSRLPSPWLPVVVFHAGLVIWADIAKCTATYVPSKRILVPFILELQQMPWPCASSMALTLEALMKEHTEHPI